jgi:hypothetical protein
VCLVSEVYILLKVVNYLILVRRVIINPFTAIFERKPLLNICLLIPLTAIYICLKSSLKCALFNRQFIVFNLSLIELIMDRVSRRRNKHLTRLN